jgi:hypothetical protein
MAGQVPTSEPEPHPKERSAAKGCAIWAAIVFGLVVVVICGVPTSRSALSSKLAAAQTARGIYLALVNYADDHNGEFPTAENNSKTRREPLGVCQRPQEDIEL